MFAIYKKELHSYFTNPIGYIFIAVFLAISGAAFALTTLYQMTSDITNYYTIMMMAYAVLLPLLTMKQFSEERKQRTEQLILTSPVRLTSFVCGKFLAAFTIFASSQIVATLAFFILGHYARVKVAVLLGSTFGLLLLGMAFIAIGVFVSSLTENQLAAAIGTIAILLVFLLIGMLDVLFQNVYVIRFLIDCLSVWNRFADFTQGVFSIPALVYYLSITAVFMALTVYVYSRRRHRG